MELLGFSLKFCLQDGDKIANNVDPDQSDQDLHSLLRPFCPKTKIFCNRLSHFEKKTEDREVYQFAYVVENFIFTENLCFSAAKLRWLDNLWVFLVRGHGP